MLLLISYVCLDIGMGNAVYVLTHTAPLYSSNYVLSALRTLTNLILSTTICNIL